MTNSSPDFRPEANTLGAGPLVLVVDDDPDSRDAARQILEDEGYLVDVVANGRAALDRLAAGPRPTLMLVDLMMPVMDGTTLLSELESSAQFSGIPVVVMTASGPDPSTSALPYPVLRKPFDVDDLVALATEYSPRLWDDEEPTDEVPVLSETAPSSRGEVTLRIVCSVCAAVATARCVGCGEAFCRNCLDAGPDGRCSKCWRAEHP
ncbi:MAG TPA: response regulator [Polyangiaceae bacterium]|jgi:CheY-like chemotaxis protein